MKKIKYEKLMFGASTELVLKSLILSFFSPLLMYPPREQQEKNKSDTWAERKSDFILDFIHSNQ